MSDFDPNAFVQEHVDKLDKAVGGVRQTGSNVQQATDQFGRRVDQVVEHPVNTVVNAYNALTAPSPRTVDLPFTSQEQLSKASAIANAPGAMDQAAQKLQQQAVIDQAAENHANTLEGETMEGYSDVPKMADGGEVFDPNAFVAQNAQPNVPSAGMDFDPEAFAEEATQDKYGTPGQQVKAGLEGVGKGLLGPIAPMVERGLGVKPEDILGREKANPFTSGAGQAAGLVGGALTGTGEAAVMGKAGELAVEAAGLAAPVSRIAKVGSSAVQQAAEMAVLQSGDEVAKMVLKDPDTSAETAISNIGLATALGGAGGAFITGAVSPLWEATVGPTVEKSLKTLQDHLNGNPMSLPKDMMKAANELGIEVPTEIMGANVSPEMAMRYNELKEVQHHAIVNAEKRMHQDISESIMGSLGKPVEDFQNYDVATAGREGMEAFKKEYKAKADPIVKEFDSLTEPFKNTKIAPAHKQELSEAVAKIAQDKGYLGPDVPQQKLVDAVLTRIPKLKTAEDIKKLVTIVGNISRENPVALGRVAGDMTKVILEAQQDVLGSAIRADKPALFTKYLEARKAYSKLSDISRTMGSELNLGRFEGPGSFLKTLESKRSPEQFLSRLSPHNNAEILKYLGEHFPQTLESIRDNEMKKIVSPAVRAAKGDEPINVKTLRSAIDKLMAGKQELAAFALPKQTIDRAGASEVLHSGIPGFKSSGTAGWQQRLTSHLPQSALAATAMVLGHNPFLGYISGHFGRLLSRELPDAYKLSLLRFVASDSPIKASGFKSMVEFLHNTIKGESMMNRAVGNVFKGGSATVLSDSEKPNDNDRQKLDKIVDKFRDNPTELMKLTDGKTGHYLPSHQVALTQATTKQIQYLASLKPSDQTPGPLDVKIKPTPAEEARYNRALDIANNPNVVLQHVKDGTIQISDLQDLKSMYPSVYTSMASKLSNQMVNQKSDDTPIPYKTRIGLSLLLGQPVDMTMSPMSIMSAQPPPQSPAPPPQTKTKSMEKLSNSYETPRQAAEQRRQSKD